MRRRGGLTGRIEVEQQSSCDAAEKWAERMGMHGEEVRVPPEWDTDATNVEAMLTNQCRH